MTMSVMMVTVAMRVMSATGSVFGSLGNHFRLIGALFVAAVGDPRIAGHQCQ